MGEVFRSARASGQVPVAVKILTPQMAAVPDYVRRFGREAAAMAQLDHPGIVRLLGRGKAGQHVYIAMELIDGESLRMWAHANRPAPRQLAALLAQVAHALAYAHARAVVHRDLKPDNVLVTKDLRTKMLDFGLAGLHAEGAQCLTQSNVAMGTANYKAPEQRKDAKRARSEEHTSELQSPCKLVCRLLPEKTKTRILTPSPPTCLCRPRRRTPIGRPSPPPARHRRPSPVISPPSPISSRLPNPGRRTSSFS